MIKTDVRTGKRGERRYMKYVISDIHGMWDKYQNMLKLIKFSAEDELYILGDVIDRGEDGIKILQDIRRHTNMHLLMGNHELMAVQTLFAQDENEWNEKMIVWAMNGGEETYYSFLECLLTEGHFRFYYSL